MTNDDQPQTPPKGGSIRSLREAGAGELSITTVLEGQRLYFRHEQENIARMRIDSDGKCTVGVKRVPNRAFLANFDTNELEGLVIRFYSTDLLPFAVNLQQGYILEDGLALIVYDASVGVALVFLGNLTEAVHLTEAACRQVDQIVKFR